MEVVFSWVRGVFFSFQGQCYFVQFARTGEWWRSPLLQWREYCRRMRKGWWRWSRPGVHCDDADILVKRVSLSLSSIILKWLVLKGQLFSNLVDRVDWYNWIIMNLEIVIQINHEKGHFDFRHGYQHLICIQRHLKFWPKVGHDNYTWMVWVGLALQQLRRGGTCFCRENHVVGVVFTDSSTPTQKFMTSFSYITFR